MRKLIILCLGATLIACGPDDPGLNSNPIDSEIRIETREILESNSRRLTFLCKTERYYQCANYFLSTETEIANNAFSFTFTSIVPPTICLLSGGQASIWVDLGSVPDGEYEVQFNNANLTNKGTLKITNADISLNFGQQNGIEIVRPETKRVPDNTYWVTIGYHAQSSSALVGEFVQKLKAQGAMFNKQLPGHYFYYQIDDSGEMVLDVENSGYYFLKGFVFQYDGDESELRDVIQIDGKNYVQDMIINVETYKGERIDNWSN